MHLQMVHLLTSPLHSTDIVFINSKFFEIGEFSKTKQAAK